MPSPNLSSAQFTLGPNNSIAIFKGGQEIDIGVITTVVWSSRQEIEKKKINLMSGFTFPLAFLHDWMGEFTIQRTDNRLDSFWYNNVEVPVRSGLPFPVFNIIQTIRESNSTISRYTFQGAQLFYDDAGTYENENGVIQKVSFSAPVRLVE